MQRSLAVALFLALSLISALALPAEVENGHYPGRSGDFVLRQKGYNAGQAYLTILSNKNVKLAQASLPETSVADLIAHLMGVAPLNPSANRDSFPRVNFLDMPRANVLFFVQSSSASGDVALTTEAYPADSIARLTSILTGSNPSKHGIVQRAWYDLVQREIVSAYSDEFNGARAASLQDVVTTAFAGNSLVVSAAACRMVASALAAKSIVLPATSNNHALHWSSDSQAFTSVYADGANKLAFSFADVEAFVASLGTYDSSLKTLSVEGVKFDLNDKRELAFFAELSFVHSLVAQLKSDERLKTLVADKASDFFTFAVSLSGLERKYGADSVQARAASSILTTTISFATEEIAALYNGRSIVEIVSASPSSHVTEELAQEVQSAIAADSVFFAKKVYPQVYSVNWLSTGETQIDVVCSHLSASLTNFDVYCAEGTRHLAVARFNEGEQVMRMLGNGTSGGGASSDDIATFQIVIWTSVMLIFAALAASVVMASVHDTSDSVIYNSPALHAKSS
jgi:hypothetical protein